MLKFTRDKSQTPNAPISDAERLLNALAYIICQRQMRVVWGPSPSRSGVGASCTAT
jgi:hypothetical protein